MLPEQARVLGADGTSLTRLDDEGARRHKSTLEALVPGEWLGQRRLRVQTRMEAKSEERRGYAPQSVQTMKAKATLKWVATLEVRAVLEAKTAPHPAEQVTSCTDAGNPRRTRVHSSTAEDFPEVPFLYLQP